MVIFYFLSFIFLFISLIAIIMLVVYLVFFSGIEEGDVCYSSLYCSPTQVCKRGKCSEIICKRNEDCGSPNICVDSYCYSPVCRVGNECPTGSACVDGYCVKIGTTCHTETGCKKGLRCFMGSCVQCSPEKKCPTGMACIDGVCKYPDPNDILDGMVTYNSFSQVNGNITAPAAYWCEDKACSPTVLCGATGSCPQSCPHCVSGVCRCTPGELYEPCNDNTDCKSGNCMHTLYGKVCTYSNSECTFNYGQGFNSCPADKPYCVAGTCSRVSTGAHCGTSATLCLTLGSVRSDNGFYCVNGICQNEPGPLHSICSTSSCQSPLVCIDSQCRLP